MQCMRMNKPCLFWVSHLINREVGLCFQGRLESRRVKKIQNIIAIPDNFRPFTKKKELLLFEMHNLPST